MSAGNSGHTDHNQIINVIKESEINELSASLNGLRVSHLLDAMNRTLLLEVKWLQTKPWVQPTWMRLSKNNKARENRGFLSRSYMPKQRPYFW